MFKVRSKCNGNIENVYDVRHDREEGEGSFDARDDIEFLIYSNDNYEKRYEWIYVSAIYYRPIEEESNNI